MDLWYNRHFKTYDIIANIIMLWYHIWCHVAQGPRWNWSLGPWAGHRTRMLAPRLRDCCDSNPQPMHRGMTYKCPWRRPGHKNQRKSAHTGWKTARWSGPELLYEIFLLLYTFFCLADQDCSCSKYVLSTADLCTPITCANPSLGNIRKDAIAVRSAQTFLLKTKMCKQRNSNRIVFRNNRLNHIIPRRFSLHTPAWTYRNKRWGQSNDLTIMFSIFNFLLNKLL
jgi:hypothetical protein